MDVSDDLIREAEEAAYAQERLWEDEHEDELELLRELEDDAAPPIKRPLPAVPEEDPSLRNSAPTSAPVAGERVALSAINGGLVGAASRATATAKRTMSDVSTTVDPFADSDSDNDVNDDDAVKSDHGASKRLRVGTEAFTADTEHTSRHESLLTKMPMGPSIELVAPSGKIFYLRIRDRKQLAAAAATTLSHSHRRAGGLLELPFSRVKRQVDDLRSVKARAAAAATTKRLARMQRAFGNGEGALDDNDDDDESDDDDELGVKRLASDGKEKQDGELWVNKYSPRRYIDLVSSETQNRELLRWLKTWDKEVFKREPRKSSHGADPAAAGADADVPKVVLLSGPPGVGKTTLAHIVARHCGYNTVEINASDDRAADAFRQRIRDATQMRGVLNMDGRPNCLILDEIDGATKAAVNVLVAMAKVRRGDGADGTKVEGGKRRKGASVPLQRPIICICNDLYAPSLRALRKVALEITMPPLSPRQLAGRLSDICKMAGVHADARALSALCEATSGDIRSCLSTLQFAVAKTKRFTMESMSEFVGQKDKNVHIFTVYDKIFSKHDPSGGGSSRPAKRAKAIERATSFTELLPLVYANGEYEKLLEGCFDGYLKVRGATNFDHSMSKAIAIGEWLTWHDHISTTLSKSQAFALMAYLPFTMIACHEQYASPTKHVLKFPNLFWSATQKTQEVMRIIEGMLDECAPRIRRMINAQILALDLATPLLDLITPAVRPVAPALMHAREKAALESVVTTMLAYNLSYKQERTEHGSYNYVLDPPIDELVRFSDDGFPPPVRDKWAASMFDEPALSARALERTKRLGYNTKQLLCQELAQRRMGDRDYMHHEDEDVATAATTAQVVTDPSANSQKQQQSSDGDGESSPSVLPKTQEEKDAFLRARMGIQMDLVKVKYEDAGLNLDFFGRKKEVVQAPMTLSQATAHTASRIPKVYFKFQEGFSNAVKKPLRLRDLL